MSNRPIHGDVPTDTGSGTPCPVLSGSGISKSFLGVHALRNVSFTLQAGEVHALMGENGAGKSTLMKIFSGVEPDFAGAMHIDGQEVRFASVRDAEAAGVAIIHQELNLVPELTVAENIFLGREPLLAGLFVNRRKAVTNARALLNRLGIDLDPETRIGNLRVGEQQLVEIAKALSVSARILIMDEPTSALSPAECRRLFAIIRQLASAGVAIIYISHRIEEVMLLADRVTVLRDGCHVVTEPIGALTQEKIITAMVGRERLGITPQAPGAAGRIVLSVRDLSFEVSTRKGWRTVLNGVSFDVHEGEIFGIGGLLGSGRTEILETIFGSSIGRRGGEVRLDGEAVSIASPRDARRHGLAMVTEDRKAKGLHLLASVRDNIALPSLGTIARFGLRSFAREARLAEREVKELGIRCTGTGQIAGTLSGGNQQKVVIGKWLATQPRVLLLDEPTRGIDVGAKQEIYELIFGLARRGLAIVLVSSELPELLLLADRILVVSEGWPRGVLRRNTASEEAIMRLAAPRTRTDPARAA